MRRRGAQGERLAEPFTMTLTVQKILSAAVIAFVLVAPAIVLA